jgi:hypothetical protein
LYGYKTWFLLSREEFKVRVTEKIAVGPMPYFALFTKNYMGYQTVYELIDCWGKYAVYAYMKQMRNVCRIIGEA